MNDPDLPVSRDSLDIRMNPDLEEDVCHELIVEHDGIPLLDTLVVALPVVVRCDVTLRLQRKGESLNKLLACDCVCKTIVCCSWCCDYLMK